MASPIFGRNYLLQQFAAQFEPDGSAFLYRRNTAAAPVRVTAAERDAFIAEFDRVLTRFFWTLVLSIVAGIIGLQVYEIMLGGEDRFYFTYIVFFGAWMIAFIPYYRGWTAPWREVRARAAVGNGRTSTEARAIRISRMSWHIFWITGFGGAAWLYRLLRHSDWTAGWNPLWLLGAAVFYGWLGYCVYVKLRYSPADSVGP